MSHSDERRQPVNRRPTEEINEIVRRYVAGDSLGALARAYRVAPVTVRGWLVARGLPVRGVALANRARAEKLHKPAIIPEQPFGLLTTIREVPDRPYKRHYWLCRCVCGREVAVRAAHLLSGKTQSCGCQQIDLIREGVTSHGLSYSPEYGVWAGVKARCLNPRAPMFEWYGGRGILVCERWAGKRGFAAFIGDMGRRPSDDLSIDRIDNNGHYSCGRCDECRAHGWPMNCRWATRRQQQENTSKTRLLTYGGETMSLKAWADRLGLTAPALGYRLKKWGLDAALSGTRPAVSKRP